MPVGPKRLVRKPLGLVGLQVVRSSSLTGLQQRARNAERELAVLSLLNTRPVEEALRTLRSSRAQLQQDVFAWAQRGFKTHGYFVEFGAADGRHLSNTYMLEADHGWTGILAEPARQWHKELIGNRPSAHVDVQCVWSRTGDVLGFVEPDCAELSTIESFVDHDRHVRSRLRARKYSVRTISLDDLLDKYGAPSDIDYLSLDTEGSEYDILAAHDFSSRRIHVITCEHNHSPSRERVHRLLLANGYQRVRTDLSLWDDWYVLAL